MKTNIYILLIFSLLGASTPIINNLSNSSYTEQDSPYILDNNITFSNGNDYAGGYIEFSLSTATTFDFLTLSSVGSASKSNGVISIVGTTVYYGNGTTAVIIGNVDGTYNGQNGQNLKINFSNNFVNGDFQIGADGDTSFAGWTAVNVTEVRLDGSYQIAGQNTPVDQTWPGSNGSLHDNSMWSSTPAQATILSDNYQDAPDIAIRMDTGRSSITQGYGIIRGPYIYSNGTVTLEVGDQVSFAWKALADGDAFDAYGYIININNGNTITILDQTGSSSGQETNWATETITISSGQEGTYRFVFVCGSYDLSGGRAVGGKLMIDDVSVTQAVVSGTITDASLTSIAQKFMYNNTSDHPHTSKTLNISAKNAPSQGGNIVDSQYQYCASEGGNCSISGTTIIWYGPPNQGTCTGNSSASNGAGYFTKEFSSQSTVACTNSNFGDPCYGVGKKCYIVDTSNKTATITIIPVNDSPVSATVNGSGNEGGTIITTLTSTDVDNSDVSNFIYSIVNQPTDITGSINIGTVTSNNWKLIFRQTAGTYMDKNSWKSHNANDPSATNYSILSTLDDSYKGADGKFHFKLVWPGASSYNSAGGNIVFLPQEWKQTSNPFTSTSVTGYEAIDINYTGQFWGGLELSSRSNTLIDGSVNHGHWFYAIGTGNDWNGHGIPAAATPSAYYAAQQVELYVETCVGSTVCNYSAVATYTHDGSELTSDSFTYRVNDGTDNSNTATANITITGINDTPVAATVNGSGNEGGTITTTLISTDVDDSNTSGFTFSIVSQPANIVGNVNIGSVSYSSGTFIADATYTHDDSQTTSDTFTYKANDGTIDSNTATANITTTAINDAPVAAAVNGSGNEGGTITTTLIATDVDNSNISDFTFSIVNQPANLAGSVSIGSVSYSSGVFTAIATYTHDNSQTTMDSFTYKANDGTADSNTATASLTITAINDAPISMAINGSGSEGGTITIAMIATDVDNSNATSFNFVIASQPVNIIGTINRGTVTYSSGTFTEIITFTHDGSETKSDNFTYKANDGALNSNISTAIIAINPINDAPIASGVNESCDEGGNVAIILISTDSDNIDPSSFNFVIINAPINGTITRGSVSYYAGVFKEVVTFVHDGSETTSESFTYNANDGIANSNTALVDLVINPINDAPVSNSVNGSGLEFNSGITDGIISTTLTAIDPDNTDPNSMVFSIVSNPSQLTNSTNVTIGTVSYESGVFYAIATYIQDGTDAASGTLSDSFTYKVNDGEFDSNISTANIIITETNDVPISSNVNGSGYEGGVISVTLKASDPDNENLSFVIVNNPLNIIPSSNVVIGSVSQPTSGNFEAVATYTHDGSEVFNDSFTYKSNDGSYSSNISTTTISISPVNDAPLTNNFNSNGIENELITIRLIATDSDSNDPSNFTFSIVEQPLYVKDSLIFSDIIYVSGTFLADATYTHDGSEFATDSLTFIANDGLSNSNTSTVNIKISGVNDAPISSPISGSGNEGQTITTTLTANDVDSSDPSGFTFSIVSQPTNIFGSVNIGPVSYSLGVFSADATYTHDDSQTTGDSFTYKANDGITDSNISTATIAITAVNDSPIAMAVNGNGNEGKTIITTLTAIDVDSSNPSSFTFNIVNQPINISGIVSVGDVSYNSGTFTALATYTHNDSQTIIDSLTYRVNDGSSYSNIAIANIAITPINDAPLLSEIGPQIMNEDDSLLISLSAFDLEGDLLSFEARSLDSINVSVSIIDSFLTLYPALDWFGVADILVNVKDGGVGLLMDSKSFTITVNSINDKPSIVEYLFPEIGHNIRIVEENLDNNYIEFSWLPSFDSDKEDTLIYLFNAEWDTTNQLNHPITTIINASTQKNNFKLSYLDLWTALDFKNRLWFEQPVMKWKVDVTDGIDTTFDYNVQTLNVGYYEQLNLHEKIIAPRKYSLYQNYPNPFNPTTQINYDIPTAGNVKLIVFNILGQEVVKLIDQWQEPGHYSIIWNSQDNSNITISSGIYFYYLETEKYKDIKKMVYLK